MAFQEYYLQFELLMGGQVFGKAGTSYQWVFDSTVTLYIGNPTLTGGTSGTVSSGTKAKGSAGGDPTISNVNGNAAFTDLYGGIYTVLVNRLDGTNWHKLPNLTNIHVGSAMWMHNSFTGADDALPFDLDLTQTRAVLGSVGITPLNDMVQVFYSQPNYASALLEDGTQYTLDAANQKVQLDTLVGADARSATSDVFHSGMQIDIYYVGYLGNHVS